MAVILLLCTGAVATCLTWHLEQYRSKDARTRIADLAANHASTPERHIGRVQTSTFPLAARVRHGNGIIADLEAVARQTLAFYPAVAALKLAAGGVVYLDSRYV
ncbi:hypothetical protein EGT07_24945 [Herbaspirillum sp. HC18]|nr:hypothetical protein EGT07_24945 [Herbaspirillum sp. HC18]